MRSPEDMLLAFENLCEKGQAPALFLDRHSIAFLSIKDSKSVDSFLYDLGSPEEYKRVLGNLKSFAVIQQRAKMAPLHATAQAFMKMLPCVFERYHDQKIREKLTKNIERFAKDGDLAKMAGLLDNEDVINRDFDGFKSAMIEYQSLKKEGELIAKRLEDQDSFGKETGKEFAAIISSVVAGVIILGVSFMFLTGQSIF